MAILQGDEESTEVNLESAEESRNLLTVTDLVRTFKVGGTPLHVLKGIRMELKERQLVMLRGRSGSGKTTLLNCLGGLDTPSNGEILFNGLPFHSMSDDQRTLVRRKHMGFIFQAFALMPLLSARENVELSLRMAGIPRAQWKDRVLQCLELVGLERRMNHRPFELSGESSSVSPLPRQSHISRCSFWLMSLQRSLIQECRLKLWRFSKILFALNKLQFV